LGLHIEQSETIKTHIWKFPKTAFSQIIIFPSDCQLIINNPFLGYP